MKVKLFFPFIFFYVIQNMSVAEKQKREKRFEEIKRVLESFSQLYKINTGEELKYLPNAAESLNNWYWIRKETDIVAYMKAESEGKELKINSYKIISSLELSVIGLQPIQDEDDNTQSMLNAQLAWTMGLTFLIDWHKLNANDVAAIILNDELRINGFVKEHIDWLAKLDIQNSYPIFSNSHTWWNLHTALELYLEKFSSK
jgi:hypothetical protein